jgi:hypothetical protein
VNAPTTGNYLRAKMVMLDVNRIKMNKYEYAVQNKITWDGITNDDTLINNYKADAPKSILWLLGKVFTVQNNNSK